MISHDPCWNRKYLSWQQKNWNMYFSFNHFQYFTVYEGIVDHQHISNVSRAPTPHFDLKFWVFSLSCVWFTEISQQGERYLDTQIENAITGVKKMKEVMQKSTEDHNKFLDALQKKKQQKEVKTSALVLNIGEFFFFVKRLSFKVID